LDDDVTLMLKDVSRRSGKPFKQVVNEAIRSGLAAERSSRPVKPFRIKARRLGLRPGLSLDNIAELLEQIEGPGHY